MKIVHSFVLMGLSTLSMACEDPIVGNWSGHTPDCDDEITWMFQGGGSGEAELFSLPDCTRRDFDMSWTDDGNGYGVDLSGPDALSFTCELNDDVDVLTCQGPAELQLGRVE